MKTFIAIALTIVAVALTIVAVVGIIALAMKVMKIFIAIALTIVAVVGIIAWAMGDSFGIAKDDLKSSIEELILKREFKLFEIK